MYSKVTDCVFTNSLIMLNKIVVHVTNIKPNLPRKLIIIYKFFGYQSNFSTYHRLATHAIID